MIHMQIREKVVLVRSFNPFPYLPARHPLVVVGGHVGGRVVHVHGLRIARNGREMKVITAKLRACRRTHDNTTVMYKAGEIR
jgi:hypothetical protein